MAMPSHHEENRPTNEVDVNDVAANAPEVDNALLAPEWRGVNEPPEVS